MMLLFTELDGKTINGIGSWMKSALPYSGSYSFKILMQVIDQHAADERVRLESLQEDLRKQVNFSAMLIVCLPFDSLSLTRLLKILHKPRFVSHILTGCMCR